MECGFSGEPEHHWSPCVPAQLNADLYEDDPELESIRQAQGYSFSDVITIHKDTLPNYEEKVPVSRVKDSSLLLLLKPFAITLKS